VQWPGVASTLGPATVLQLVYISTSRQVLEPQVLDHILTVSRRNNAAAGVTGLLLSGGRRFLQVLEGPADKVQATYQRISHDPRHFAIVELSRREVGAQQFGDWAMGYNAGGEAGEGNDLREVVRKLILPLADRDLRAQFTGFAEIHARAA
jgi:hypothetical protein